MTDDEFFEPRTTTVLTIDLPTEISARLRRVCRRQRRSLQSITLEALEAWLATQDEDEDPS